MPNLRLVVLSPLLSVAWPFTVKERPIAPRELVQSLREEEEDLCIVQCDLRREKLGNILPDNFHYQLASSLSASMDLLYLTDPDAMVSKLDVTGSEIKLRQEEPPVTDNEASSDVPGSLKHKFRNKQRVKERRGCGLIPWCCTVGCSFLVLALLISIVLFMSMALPGEETEETTREATYKFPVASLAPPIAQIPLSATVAARTNLLPTITTTPTTRATNTRTTTESSTTKTAATTTTSTATTTTSTTTTMTSTTMTTTSTSTTTTSTTSTTTTKSTSTTTTSPLPRSSPPTIRYPLVCTVTYRYIALFEYNTIGATPPDGFCDLFFYDSLNREGDNNLGGAYNDKLAHFFNLSRVMRTTGLGVSFYNDAFAINVQSYSPLFEPALMDLWNRGISHFGVINIFGSNTQETVIIGVLKFLQKIYSVILKSVTQQRPCYMVLGAQFDRPGSHEAMRHTKSIFKPSLFIALTQKSYIQYNRPGCINFPTSFLDYPRHINQSNVRDCISILNWTLANSIDIPVAISFTMQNRLYTVASREPSNFEFFEPCINESYKVSWNVCKAKASYVGIPFGIAVFDIEHDTLSHDCPHRGIRKGKLTRSSTIRKVRDFVRDRFSHRNQLQNCLAAA